MKKYFYIVFISLMFCCFILNVDATNSCAAKATKETCGRCGRTYSWDSSTNKCVVGSTNSCAAKATKETCGRCGRTYSWDSSTNKCVVGSASGDSSSSDDSSGSQSTDSSGSQSTDSSGSQSTDSSDNTTVTDERLEKFECAYTADFDGESKQIKGEINTKFSKIIWTRDDLLNVRRSLDLSLTDTSDSEIISKFFTIENDNKKTSGCINSIYICEVSFKDFRMTIGNWNSYYYPLVDTVLISSLPKEDEAFPVCNFSGECYDMEIHECQPGYIDKTNSTKDIEIIQSVSLDPIYAKYILDMRKYYCYNQSAAQCEKNFQSYNASKQKLIEYCRNILKHGNYIDSSVKSCLNLSKDLSKIEGIEYDDANEELCGLGSKLINWIKNGLKWIKYILPAIVIILGIIDFIKAIASDNDDEMKKAQQKFIKRLIAAALVFIVPFLIEFILNIFKIGDNPFCGILK